MNNFEATVLITPNTTKNDLKIVSEKFEKYVVDQGGSVIGKEDWGLRDLAYKVKSLKKAFYLFYQIDIEGSKIQALKKYISQNESIFRYLFIKVNSHSDLPTRIIKGKE